MEGWFTNRRDVQQEVRSTGTIIDTSVAAGSIQLSRTEIDQNGQVRFRVAEYQQVSLIDRTPEKKVFEHCVEQNR